MATSSGIRGAGSCGTLDAWYAAAREILSKLKKQNEMPKTGKELIKFIKEIGYEKKGPGKGDHVIFEFKDKTKFEGFLKEMDVKGIDVNSVPVAKTVSVDSCGTNPNTVAGVLDRVFGLDDLGQKPPKK